MQRQEAASISGQYRGAESTQGGARRLSCQFQEEDREDREQVEALGFKDEEAGTQNHGKLRGKNEQ